MNPLPSQWLHFSFISGFNGNPPDEFVEEEPPELDLLELELDEELCFLIESELDEELCFLIESELDEELCFLTESELDEELCFLLELDEDDFEEDADLDAELFVFFTLKLLYTAFTILSP